MKFLYNLLKSKKTLKHDIKIYYNIFSKKEQKKIFNEFLPFFSFMENGTPGKQTNTGMHIICRSLNMFDPSLEICKRMDIDPQRVNSMWGYYSDKSTESPIWHNHFQKGQCTDSEKISVIYMLDNPDELGTLFKFGDEEYTFKCPTNSMIVFPSVYIHSGPKSIKPRYSIAMDITTKLNTYI